MAQMLFSRAVLAAGFSVSSEHAVGLELAHSHGQEAWPLETGDSALIAEALRLLPAAWTWEDKGEAWVFGGVRTQDVETHDALVFHMLHHHGLAPLIASHAEGWAAFLAAFEPDPADHASLGASALTREAKVLAVAEKEFPPIQALVQRLSQLSLSGLRNLHSYDHQAEWRCLGDKGHADGALQAMADARTVAFVQATHTPRVRAAVRLEYRGLRHAVATQADLQDARGRHVEQEFLQLGQSTRAWGASTPIEPWAVEDLTFRIVHVGSMFGKQCLAEGVIDWEAFDERSAFSVRLTAAECTAVEGAGARAKDRVSRHVREWVYAAVERQRVALRAHRGLVWAQEEASFAEHGVVAEQPRKASSCAAPPIVRRCCW